MSNYYSGSSFCIAILILNALTVGGYSGQVQRGDGPESSPADVKLTIRTRGGASVFQIGETIELDLLYTSTARKKYLVIDSSPSFFTERITAAPLSGWDDPVADFKRICPVMSLGGGLSSSHVLSAKPFVLDLELNKWIRFKDPGEYQISVQSQRSGWRTSKRLLTLNSNRLSLKIVPAVTQWQEQTLRNAVTVLDETSSNADLAREQRKARWQATSVVRNLGTPVAAHVMAHRLQSEDLAYDFLLGLAESPAREAALEQMEGLLTDPDFPVSSHFLCAVSLVALEADRTAHPADYQKALEAHFRDELRPALKNKRGKAQVESTRTADSVR